MKTLCVFGKYAYGDPARELSPEYTSFLPALKQLGHIVTHFESWQRNLYKDYADLNLKLYRTILEESPDIMFTVQLNYEIWLETLEAIQALGTVITICWTTDDSWKYKEVSRFIGKFYNLISTTYKNMIPFYLRDGILNVFLTQWAASSLFLQTPIPAKCCRYKVSFIGAAHGNRKNRIEKLRQSGIDVTCFGYGWPNGPVKTEQMAAIIQQSVISLNFTNSKGQNQIKARTFEIPGAGGFLLTEYAPGLEEFYRIEKEVETFSNSTELQKKIEYYLVHTERRDEIANAGFERTRQEHTYELRLHQLIGNAQKHKSSNNIATSAAQELITLEAASKSHSLTPLLKIIKLILTYVGCLFFGKIKGPRAARRLVYEISWRFLGYKTYTASGLPGRLFPEL